MRLTDWRGNEYGPGDTVFYPRMSGRSVEICEATVVDIWTTYRDPGSYDWMRLEEGAEVPERNGIRCSTALRVKVQPNGRGSRNFWRTDYKYAKDAEGEYQRIDTGIKPVVLNIIENVTKVTDGS